MSLSKVLVSSLLGVALLAPGAARAEEEEAPATGITDPKVLFDKKCAMCHGADGQAKTKMGEKQKIDSFADAAWQDRHSDEKILKAIAEGVPKTKMKAFKGKLSDEQIASLAKYVRTFRPADAAPAKP